MPMGHGPVIPPWKQRCWEARECEVYGFWSPKYDCDAIGTSASATSTSSAAVRKTVTATVTVTAAAEPTNSGVDAAEEEASTMNKREAVDLIEKHDVRTDWPCSTEGRHVSRQSEIDLIG